MRARLLFAVILHILTLTICFIKGQGSGSDRRIRYAKNETFHIFLLLVPDSSLNRLHLLRQDDEDGGGGGGAQSFAQTGEYLGQIIQGVLGGDLGPVFAGSVKFVEEPNAQQNLQSFLGGIAPALNLLLREAYNRAQVAFGFATTPKPLVASPSPASTVFEYEEFNNTISGNSTLIFDYETFPNSNLTQKLKLQQRPPPAQPTTSWQYVLNRINSETTTVPPLPLIQRRTLAPLIPDDDDEDIRKHKL